MPGSPETPLVRYEVQGWYAYVEQDHYETGCDSASYLTKAGSDRFTGKTLAECIEACREFACAEKEEISYDLADEDPGRFDMQVMETDLGTRADEHDLARWREGACRLWLATYTFYVQRVTRTVVADPRPPEPDQAIEPEGDDPPRMTRCPLCGEPLVAVHEITCREASVTLDGSLWDLGEEVSGDAYLAGCEGGCDVAEIQSRLRKMHEESAKRG